MDIQSFRDIFSVTMTSGYFLHMTMPQIPISIVRIMPGMTVAIKQVKTERLPDHANSI